MYTTGLSGSVLQHETDQRENESVNKDTSGLPRIYRTTARIRIAALRALRARQTHRSHTRRHRQHAPVGHWEGPDHQAVLPLAESVSLRVLGRRAANVLYGAVLGVELEEASGRVDDDGPVGGATGKGLEPHVGREDVRA